MAYDGTPNSTIGGTIATLQTITLMQQALTPLEKDTIFMQFMKKDVHSQQKGRTVMWYRPVNFTDPTSPTPANETTVGSSLTYRNNTVQGTLAVYDDWTSLSTQLREFSPTNDFLDMGRRLSYYAALLFDNSTRIVVDYFQPSLKRTPISTYARVRDFSAGRTVLLNANVKGLSSEGGNFAAAISPLMTYDIEFDPEIGSPNDLFKRSANLKGSILTDYPMNSNKYMEHGGVSYYTTTNVYSYTQSSTNYYRGYMFGDESFGTVELAGKPLRVSGSKDAKERFTIQTKTFNEISLPDPTNKIGAIASFRGHHCCANLMLTDNVNRAVTWDFQSSIA